MEITFYRKLANKVSDAVIGNQEYSAADAKRIRYGLVCIFSDLYKFILFLAIFSIFSLTKEFLIAFIGVLLLRPFLGGFHAKNELTCIFMSFSMMLISILVGNMNILPSYLQLALIILLAIIGVIIAPVRINAIGIKKVTTNNIRLKFLTCIMTTFILIVDYNFLPGQIIFLSIIQVYILALYQLTKNYIFAQNK